MRNRFALLKPPHHIGETIRKLRAEKKITQEDFCGHLSMTQSALSKLERSPDILVSKLFKAAQVLGVDLLELLGVKDSITFNISHNKKAQGLIIYTSEKQQMQDHIQTLKDENMHLRSLVNKLIDKKIMHETVNLLINLKNKNMKTRLFIALMLTSIVGFCQTATKTIIATYQSAGTYGGEWSGLIFTADDGREIRFINKTFSNIVMYKFWDDQAVGEDPDDATFEPHVQKNIIGKKFKINYTTKKVSYKGFDSDGASTVTENVIISFEPTVIEDLTGATCKIYKSGELRGVVVNGVIYELGEDGKKGRGQALQNKSEICVRDKCTKMVIEPDGTFYSYNLPNITDKTLWGKIMGNEVLYYKSPYGSYKGGIEHCGLTYTGDKLQAAIAASLNRWFK